MVTVIDVSHSLPGSNVKASWLLSSPVLLEFRYWHPIYGDQRTLLIEYYLLLSGERDRGLKRLCSFLESVDFLLLSTVSSMGGTLIGDKLTLGKIKGSSGQ